MATPNPLENSHSNPPPTISTKTFHIAGILTTVYGLSELSPSCDTISCLWLLHPRLSTKDRMTPIASETIHAFNSSKTSNKKKGLIAVAFDQRNHGSREVVKIANESWKAGNKMHAPDMFSIINGTVIDTSLLMDHLEGYLFPERGAVSIGEHFVLGVSLGGHAVWQVLFREERVKAGVVIIGCPDYMHVMKDRARLTKLETYTKDGGASFIGSADFPNSLVNSCSKYDPKGILFGTDNIVTAPVEPQQAELRQKLDTSIKGKAILVCSGGDDKLVPYRSSKEFLDFLKNATAQNGWYADGGIYLEDNVYDGVGHAFSPGMVKDTVRFFLNLLDGKEPGHKRPDSNL